MLCTESSEWMSASELREFESRREGTAEDGLCRVFNRLVELEVGGEIGRQDSVSLPVYEAPL